LINNASGVVVAQTWIALQAGPWTRYEYKLVTGAVAPSIANHLEFTVAHPGTLWLQFVSLMAPTFHKRPNGNRVDLMERMAAMHPKFFRAATIWRGLRLKIDSIGKRPLDR
jgi:alpha-N-arabinofuranosidase